MTGWVVDGDGFDSSPSDFTYQQYVPTAISATFPVVVTVDNHPFILGNALRCTMFYRMPFASSSGMEQLNNQLVYVGFTTINTFTLTDQFGNGIDGRNFTPFVYKGIAQMTLTGPLLDVNNPAPAPPSGQPPFPPV